MKKLLFILLSALSLTAFAQTKKVAILEVVDRENKLNYSQKLLLRSNMATAVSNTAGYEAYDRTDMDAILSEHDFQRTGLVSKEQISQLGEMTGAQYVLIIEAVELKTQELYVTVKLLDVKTAHIEVAGNEIMNDNAQDIIRGCQTLAKKIFKPIVVQKKIETGRISQPRVQFREGKYLYEDKIITKTKAASLVLRETHEISEYWEIPEVKKIKQGYACIISGYCLWGIGAGVLISGRILWANDTYREWEQNMAFVAAGAAAFAASIPLLTCGYVYRDKAVKKYVTNPSYSQNTPLTFNLTAGQNGLGIAMNF